MSSLASRKGITPKALSTMRGFVSGPTSINPAGYLNELIDTLKYESDEKPVVVKEFCGGRWVVVAEA